MRTITTLSCVLLVGACAPADDASEIEDAAPATEAVGASAVRLADFAGTWESQVVLEGVDEPVPSTLSGSASADDWTLSLEGRPDIPLQVSIEGDSLISVSDEYESILRPGVMVVVRTAAVRDGDMLMGNVVTTYQAPGGEERVAGTLHGRRVR